MEFIGNTIFPSIDKEIIAKMVEFSNTVGSSLLKHSILKIIQNFVLSKSTDINTWCPIDWQVIDIDLNISISCHSKG